MKQISMEDLVKALSNHDDMVARARAMNGLPRHKSKKKKNRSITIDRSYQFQKSMMYAIQAITGHQTHEIIGKLVELAEKHIEDSDIDITLLPKDNDNRGRGWGNERRLRTYAYYPDTEVHIGCYITFDDYQTKPGFQANLKFNFKLPSNSLKLNQKEYEEYITDGILCDASQDVEKPKLKGTLTKEEKEARELKKKFDRAEKAKLKKLKQNRK